MHKWGTGRLKSGGSGKPVKAQKQAVAIMLSEKRAAAGGKQEYQAKPGSLLAASQRGFSASHPSRNLGKFLHPKRA